jgi:hypothetical protein
MGSLPKSKNRPTQDLTIGQQFLKGGTLLQYLSTLNLSQNRVICKVTLSSPCLWASFHPYPLFQWYLQSNEILLNFSMKCWNSAFHAQGLRVIIVVVLVGAVKIHVAPVKALRKNERQDETQFTTKISFLSFAPRPPPTFESNVLCCRFFLNLILCMTKLRVLVLCFPYFRDNSFHLHLYFTNWVPKLSNNRKAVWIGNPKSPETDIPNKTKEQFVF